VHVPEYPLDTGRTPIVAREHLVNAGVIIAIFVVLAALGVAAEMLHRAQGTAP
jgi:hypothetical protein